METLNEEEPEKVTIEDARLRTITTIVEATDAADFGNFDEAQDKIIEAQNMLEDVVDQPEQSIEMLKYELYELIKLMQSQDIYTSLGRAFALAVQTSHDRQRFATRGAATRNLRTFATSFMDNYLKQVIPYDKNPTMQLPTTTDDFKDEIDKNPMAAFPIGALNYFLEELIQSLQAMQDKVDALR